MISKQKTKVIYPGTFDPITNGHIDIIERALRLFDSVIVAIAKNEKKSSAFDYEERIALTKKTLSTFKNVEVHGFSNLLINFAQEHNAFSIIRGLRAVSDFEYEFQLAEMNKKMEPRFETIFFTSYEQHAYISSSMIREIASLGGDVSAFVPQEVRVALAKKFTVTNS